MTEANPTKWSPAVFLIIVLAFLASLFYFKHRPAPIVTRNAPPSVIQRFVPIADASGAVYNLALDTQTGRLCKTWPWNHNAKDAGLDDLPTCEAIYDPGKYSLKNPFK
jgi:hypothetical protein